MRNILGAAAAALAMIIPAQSFAQQGGGGGGAALQGGDCAAPPALSLRINDRATWTRSPEQIVALPGGAEIEDGPQAGMSKIPLKAVLPPGREYARIMIRSCNGRVETISGPWLDRPDEVYSLSITRKGFLKLTVAAQDGKARTLLRDVRVIEARQMDN